MRMHIIGRTAIIFAVVISPTAVAATTWQVATTGCSDTSCNPCCTVQAAVERCSPNDVVSVGPGTYVEQVDLRQMATPGTITLEASGGPGTVLVSPTSGRSLTISGSDTGTVTVDGIDFTSPDAACVFLAHSGDVVLRDVTANDCGYTAFELDATGNVTIERCRADFSSRTGVQVDGAASTVMTDVQASGNAEHGIYVLNIAGGVEISGVTADTNASGGLRVHASGAVTIDGSTAADNGMDGITVETDGDVRITATGVSASGGQGIRVQTTGSVHLEACTSTSNVDGDGVEVTWNGVDPVQRVTLVRCTATGNSGFGRHGFVIRNVTGPVTVSGCSADGNFETGFRLSDLEGRLLVAGTASTGNGNLGFHLENVGHGPFALLDSLAGGNAAEGIGIQTSAVEIDALWIRRTRIVDNGLGGLELGGLTPGGDFAVSCTDVAGNADGGLRLWSAVDVNAARVWWGDPSGPSGEGPGSGDSVISGPGTVSFTPWLTQPMTSSSGVCEIFGSNLESGSLYEWDRVVP